LENNSSRQERTQKKKEEKSLYDRHSGMTVQQTQRRRSGVSANQVNPGVFEPTLGLENNGDFPMVYGTTTSDKFRIHQKRLRTILLPSSINSGKVQLTKQNKK
jgi:hypothetical protein